MRVVKHYIVFCLIAFAFSCTQEINITPKDFTEQLVVNSSLNSDSFISIFVSKTNTISSQLNYSPVTDALVKIYENKVFLGNLGHSVNGRYALAIRPKKNVEYFIEINSGNLECTALDLIPDTVSVVSVQIDTVPFLNGQGFLQFTMEPSNIPGVKEYFEVSAQFNLREYKKKFGVVVDSNDIIRTVNLETIDPVILSNANNKNFKEQYLFTDDALVASSKIKFGTYDARDLSANEKVVSCILIFKSLSKDSYSYYNSLYSQIYFRTDPFSLPVRIQTNVLNGYGIFGGVQEDRVEILF